MNTNFVSLSNHKEHLEEWINKIAAHFKPDKIHWCTGTQEEYDSLCNILVNKGTFIKLNQQKKPGCYACFSDPSDVARVEDRTYICSLSRENAGPTNNWKAPKEMKEIIEKLSHNCMTGRTMYIIPFCMGPLGSPYSKYGIQITDSEYVVVNMKIMTRMGDSCLPYIYNGEYVKCVHTVGSPLIAGQQDLKWPCNPKEKYITHFPEEKLIISYGSGYGGNALLGKKCLALRIASVQGKEENWLAEHMLIMGVESPTGEKDYIAAAFPSSCGKTNFSMLIPPPHFKDWKITTVGDDIAWIHKHHNGKLYAINPEAGYFGVVPGTNALTNPNALHAISKNTIFTNVALTSDLDVWWEGLTKDIPEGLTDWTGQPYNPNSGKPAAHPNSRFTAPAIQNPVLDENWDNKEGVPLSALIFGGRRSKTVPLVVQSFNWAFGVYQAATMASETTSASFGEQGKVRRDPFAMLPFIGYNIGHYFNHWLQFGKNLYNPPRIFNVNWFRKNEKGQYIWPGFGENIRVLLWIINRIKGRTSAIECPIGWVPRFKDMDLDDLNNFSVDDFKKLISVDTEEWKEELLQHEQLFSKLYNVLPKEIHFIRELLLSSLWRSPENWEMHTENEE